LFWTTLAAGRFASFPFVVTLGNSGKNKPSKLSPAPVVVKERLASLNTPHNGTERW
jgi:hypothetical protein